MTRRANTAYRSVIYSPWHRTGGGSGGGFFDVPAGTLARRRHSAFMTGNQSTMVSRRVGVLLYWRRATTLIMSARADRQSVLSVDLSRTGDRTTRETVTARLVLDGQDSRVWTVD